MREMTYAACGPTRPHPGVVHVVADRIEFDQKPSVLARCLVLVANERLGLRIKIVAI